ncbi:MAG: cisplatin damage response ATP-dependent DNA ligase [Pseudomonadota bacterium]
MTPFSILLDGLTVTPARLGKLKLLTDYMAEVPDPDRGYGIAAITRDLDLPSVKPALLRALVAERTDAELFALSYDYVGDLAETVSLIWEPRAKAQSASLTEVVEVLRATSRSDAPRVMADLLDRFSASERYALLKLATGGLRVGVSARLAKQALSLFGKVDVVEIEELWHGLAPPYLELFAWLEGRAEKPVQAAAAPFRPVMLATALDEDALDSLTPGDFLAEWKWDGIRVQATCEGGIARLYSRTGDDISGAFPDLVAAMQFEGSLDGELLVRKGDKVLPFSELQKRLNRKTVSKAALVERPAAIRAYDLLQEGGENLRALPFETRRARLEAFVQTLPPARFDLSPLVPFTAWDSLKAHRQNPPDAVIEGLMLKRRDSAYVPGRPKGPWFKWKRDPFTIDAVLMYAQRGHGKRSGFYSDYTFGCWTDDDSLVPVGKAYFGFTDEELRKIDKFVRDHTLERFGPVRSVRADGEVGLVLEIAFEGLNRSPRHKSGVAMRFPRISRLRWDKPVAEADTLNTLKALLP